MTQINAGAVPTAAVQRIGSFLPPGDVNSMMRSCKLWQKALDRSAFWKALAARDWQHIRRKARLASGVHISTTAAVTLHRRALPNTQCLLDDCLATLRAQTNEGLSIGEDIYSRISATQSVIAFLQNQIDQLHSDVGSTNLEASITLTDIRLEEPCKQTLNDEMAEQELAASEQRTLHTSALESRECELKQFDHQLQMRVSIFDRPRQYHQ